MHKVQGVTLPAAPVSFDLHKQKCINFCQIFVAFGRITSLNGLYITGKPTISVVNVNNDTVKEYARMREHCCMSAENKSNKNAHSIASLNVI